MKDKIYKSRYEAYPFLSDPLNDLKCDFEIYTDEIASHIGLLRSIVKEDHIKEELLNICEKCYHINPSLRTFVSVTEDELKFLEKCTNRLREEVKDRCNKFVLPVGCESAGHTHVLRSKCKALVRLLYRYRELGNEVPDILFDFTNLLSGYFFNLALKLNQLDDIDEIEFKSRNYK
ncbi:MAG: ATP--cob(I)alamin adenosyltransferase [Clostridiales bacterium]|uniref:ATP:cob(I)alamin adenosyltransferase n=1 Tax=Clostridium sp. N3C TaxID=1776758 RepID=UPI00092DF9EF|nr:hypothetical protein [Clostridium sp. N3C]NLZ50023.1 ATP--cob(I)alamin adenosyltransferase [Clostridiales bacterium]SCN26214.1 ATP:cob(I)alamin adenosyltransferase [Clostridium sp. N3C]